PIESDLGTIDRDAAERIVEIDDGAFVDHDAAVEHAWNAVGPDLGANAPGERQIGLVLVVAPTHGEHQVFGRDLLRIDVDDAVSRAVPGRHRCAHLPRPLADLRAERDCDAAAFGPRHAQIDVGECPLLAVALVVDREVAAFEPDLAEIAAVQSAGVEALDPG